MTAPRLVHYPTTHFIDYGGRPCECFANASSYVYELGEEDGMRYCEGLAYDTVRNVAFHHAWAVDMRQRANYEVTEMPHESFMYWGFVLRLPPVDAVWTYLLAPDQLARIGRRIRRDYTVLKVYGTKEQHQ